MSGSHEWIPLARDCLSESHPRFGGRTLDPDYGVDLPHPSRALGEDLSERSLDEVREESDLDASLRTCMDQRGPTYGPVHTVWTTTALTGPYCMDQSLEGRM